MVEARETVDLVATPVPPLPLGHDCREAWALVAIAKGSGPFADRDFDIRQCAICGVAFTCLVPTEADSGTLYADRESNDFQARDGRVVAWLKGIAARRDAGSICRGIDRSAAITILDYGCGNGAFVEALQAVRPSAQVIGADLHPDAPSGLAGNRYVPYAQLDAWRGRTDLILCRHVLEHTYDPVRLLVDLGRLLRPGGSLVVEVPSFDSAIRRMLGRYWSGFYVPYHTLHFMPDSLTAVASAAGLRVERIERAEMPMMGRSIGARLGGGYGLGLFALGMSLHPMQVIVGHLTQRGACLRVWAS